MHCKAVSTKDIDHYDGYFPLYTTRIQRAKQELAILMLFERVVAQVGLYQCYTRSYKGPFQSFPQAESCWQSLGEKASSAGPLPSCLAARSSTAGDRHSPLPEHQVKPVGNHCLLLWTGVGN